MKFELSMSSGDEERTNDPMGALCGSLNKPTKYVERIKSNKTDSSHWKHTIEINTLEELLDFQQKCGHSVIISSDDDGAILEVYDTYRE